MMTTQDDPQATSAPEVEEPQVTADAVVEEEEGVAVNRWQRITAVLLSPAEAMRGVKLNGGWLAPLLVFLVCSTLYVLLAGPYLGEEQMDRARDQMQERVAQGSMTQEQADQAMEVSARFQEGMGGRITMLIGTIVVIFIISLVMSILLLLIGNIIHNGNAKFGTYWSMTWYAGVIGSIGMLLMGLLIMLTQDAQGGHLGLGILTKSNPTSALHAAAATVTIFSVWESIVAGIGLSIMGKIGRGLGIVWGLIVFVILPAALTYILTNAFNPMAG